MPWTRGVWSQQRAFHADPASRDADGSGQRRARGCGKHGAAARIHPAGAQPAALARAFLAIGAKRFGLVVGTCAAVRIHLRAFAVIAFGIRFLAAMIAAGSAYAGPTITGPGADQAARFSAKALGTSDQAS